MIAASFSTEREAADALGMLKDTRAIDPLRLAYEDDMVCEVRECAATSLMNFGITLPPTYSECRSIV